MNRLDQDQSKFFRHPRFRYALLLRASFTHHRYELHTHDTYVIGIVTRGVERLRVGSRRHVAPCGSIILVNPEEPHDGEPGAEGGWAYRTFYPPASLLSEVGEELGAQGPPGFRQAIVEDHPLARALVEAHRLAELGHADAEASFLIALRALLARHGGTPVAAAEAMRRGCAQRLDSYRAFIEAHLASPIDLGRLAQLAGVTRFQVIRDFKVATGLTPGAFIRQQRQAAAARLIRQGVSLADASAAAGFADQSHLTRVFRAISGVTPSMFRAAVA